MVDEDLVAGLLLEFADGGDQAVGDVAGRLVEVFDGQSLLEFEVGGDVVAEDVREEDEAEFAGGDQADDDHQHAR